MLVYVATYFSAQSEGIYVMRMDEQGTLSRPVLAAKVDQPSFLLVHPNQKILYAVSEVADAHGMGTGAVCAYAIDAATGMLSFLNDQSSGGNGPCFLSLDRDQRNLFVANYEDGTIAVLPVGADGKLAPPTAVVQHKGHGTTERQTVPHAHSMLADPTNRFALAADLGLDQVVVYRFDAARGTLEAHGAGTVAPGSGPRHLSFSADGRFLYVINEMGSTVTVFAWEAQAGALREVQTLSTLPSGFAGYNDSAEMLIHPSGRWLYASNRGDDSLVWFDIDKASGKLTWKGRVPSGGKTPRGFGIDPAGRFLIVTNQDANSMIVFGIGPDGALSKTGISVELGLPASARFCTAG